MEEAKGPDPTYNNDKASITPWSLFLLDLSLRLGRPVIDKTGLKGAWYVKLRYTTDNGTVRSGMGIAGSIETQPGYGGPSIFYRGSGTVGLGSSSPQSMTRHQGPVDVLVIDSN